MKKFSALKLSFFLTIITFILLIFTFFKKTTPEPVKNDLPNNFLAFSQKNNEKKTIKNRVNNVCFNDKTLNINNFIRSLNLPQLEEEKLTSNLMEKVTFKPEKEIKVENYSFFARNDSVIILLTFYLKWYGIHLS